MCQQMLGSTRGYCAEWAGAPSGESSDLEHVVQGRLHFIALLYARLGLGLALIAELLAAQHQGAHERRAERALGCCASQGRCGSKPARQAAARASDQASFEVDLWAMR